MVPAFIPATILGGCLASAQGIERQAGAAAASERQANGSARPATYDPSAWFKVDFWGNEWPDGFSVDRASRSPFGPSRRSERRNQCPARFGEARPIIPGTASG
ncbi:hypothetical protein SSBR45G_10570 [Bradyrhizobium sp. SSBR45G]|nr:hypothetical protein SSBR45G_10570 [Bradyrhizobium sp. SSBR45G]GLH83367.1 hypothetical protein SSBR45R_08270 [Bradyrhizobium sp. SSBR45R]